MKKFLSMLIEKNKILVVSFVILIGVVSFFMLQKNNATTLDGILNNGEKYEKSGKLAIALDYYNKAVRVYPGSYEAHMKLGNLFRLVNEPEKAKIEFYRAIKLSEIGKYDAYFAMADLYMSDDDYELAQALLMQIRDIPLKEIADKIGDFYLKWGDHIYKDNPMEAIRKYKIAYKFYFRNKGIKAVNIRKHIETSYSDIADSLMATNNVDDAVNILNSSIDYSNNATAHYKLAKIYKKKNPDIAIREFTMAFALNSSIAPPDEFVQLLIKKGDNFYKNGDATTAELYYNKARKLSTHTKIPYLNDNNIIVNLLASKSSKDNNNLYYTPGISFKITNISKVKIPYLKVKVVFNLNGKEYSENVKEITTPEIPIPPFSITSAINIYAAKPLNYETDSSKIEIQIYISQQKPDKWKLYRITEFQE